MKPFDSVLLYVDSPRRSAELYQKLFGGHLPELSDNFALLIPPSGTPLAFWARHDVNPSPPAGAEGMELMVHLDSDAAVDQTLAEAQALGCRVLQPAVALDFGYTWLVTTPDGHRIRAFCPPA